MEEAINFIHDFYTIIGDYLNSHEYIDTTLMNKFVKQYNLLFHKRVNYDYGATRHAIILEKSVVKFDIRNTEKEYFGGCEKEFKAYEYACLFDMDHLFAPVNKYEYKGKAYYIMPIVRYINEDLEDDEIFYEVTEDEKKFLLQYFDDLHSGNYGHDDFGELKIFDYACNTIGG